MDVDHDVDGFSRLMETPICLGTTIFGNTHMFGCFVEVKSKSSVAVVTS